MTTRPTDPKHHNHAVVGSPDRAPRKPYQPPRAEVLGTVYDLTFGNSPTDIGDSLPPFNTRP
jgi:hypothetical protein